MTAPAATRQWLAHRPFAGALVPVLGVLGLGLVAYLVVELGPSRIVTQLAALGSILPIVLVLTAAKYPFQAAGWRLTLPPDARPGWAASISATIAGDALGYLTWAGPFTGEPIRAALIRHSVPMAAGVAAGAAERVIYSVTATAFVGGVLLGLLARASRVAPSVALGAGLLAAGTLAITGYRICRGRHAGLAPAPRADLAAPAGSGGPRGLAAFLNQLRDLYRFRRHVLPGIVLLCVAQHLLLIGEAWVMLRVLVEDATLGTALVFEAVTKVVNSAGALVPGRLGVAEGGSALLADALGLAASCGLSFALMRRVRALIWALVGVALLPVAGSGARPAR